MLDEGGFIEYLTAIALFAATLLALLTGRRFWRRSERVLAGISYLYAAFLFVFWGEEVRWGAANPWLEDGRAFLMAIAGFLR